MSLQSNSMLTDISSGPLDFPEFRFLSMQAMPLLVICMLSSLAVDLNTKLGRVLKLTMGGMNLENASTKIR